MEGGLLLDVLVGEGPSVLALLASEDQPLLVCGVLHVLDLVLDLHTFAIQVGNTTRHILPLEYINEIPTIIFSGTTLQNLRCFNRNPKLCN